MASPIPSRFDHSLLRLGRVEPHRKIEAHVVGTELRLEQLRLNRRLLARLIESIVSGDYLPGALLPREVDLVEMSGVSRGVVREALRGLEERGVVTVRHGHGAIVCDESSWDILAPDVLPAVLGGPTSVRVLREVIEVRRILEVEAAVLAAARGTSGNIERIAGAVGTMERLARDGRLVDPEHDAFLEADIAFHEAVIAATGNRALQRLVSPIHSALLESRRPLARPEYRETRAVPEHAAVLRAIQDHDPDGARAAMMIVFNTVTSYLSEYASSARAKVTGGSPS